MRIAFPFLVPLACLLGILVVPDQAVAFSAALLSSIITLGLAAPALFSSSETNTTAPQAKPSAAPTTTNAPQPQPSAAQPSAATAPAVSSPQPARSWLRQLWWGGIALEVAAIAWTFVSLGGLVVAPENAHSWSLHLGGSMLMVMFWTPLVVFMRPSDNEDAVSNQPPQDFVAEEEQTLRPPVAEQNRSETSESSFWSYGETQGDSFAGRDEAVDVAPRRTADTNATDASKDVQTRRPPSPDSGDAWAAWPDEDPLLDESETSRQSASDSDREASEPARASSAPSDDSEDMEARRALWSFPDNDEKTQDRAPEPSSGGSAPREMKAAQKAAAAEWDTSDHDDEMAWDILESILEEDESETTDGSGSWEPDEWPDFNYDV